MSEVRLVRLSRRRVTQKQRASAFEHLERIRREVRKDVQGRVQTIRHVSQDGYVTETTPIYDEDGELVEIEVRDLGRNPRTREQEAADLRAMLATERVQGRFRKGTRDSRVTFVERDDEGMYRTEARRGV